MQPIDHVLSSLHIVFGSGFMLHAAEASKGSLLLTKAPWHTLDMPSMGMSTCTAVAASAKEGDLLFASLQGIPQFPRTRDSDPWHGRLYAH